MFKAVRLFLQHLLVNYLKYAVRLYAKEEGCILHAAFLLNISRLTVVEARCSTLCSMGLISLFQ
jgi:hypothetical protein